VVLSKEIDSFGSLPVYGNLEIVTAQIFLPFGNIWSFSTVSAVYRHPQFAVQCLHFEKTQLSSDF
jgi:hypothetical protein